MPWPGISAASRTCIPCCSAAGTRRTTRFEERPPRELPCTFQRKICANHLDTFAPERFRGSMVPPVELPPVEPRVTLPLVELSPPLSQLVDRPRPVASQQAAERAAGEEAAAGLAAGAVVGLVLGVADALHGGAAYGAGLAVAPVHRHLGAERRHLLREPIPRLP